MADKPTQWSSELLDWAVRVVDLAIYKPGDFEHLEALSDAWLNSDSGQSCARLARVLAPTTVIRSHIENLMRAIWVQGFLLGGAADAERRRRIDEQRQPWH